ncbi:HEAT repeat-containing protein 6-like isoform X1 [Neltuma alba]|uniref:HEAT repeat-containing protein 6-like isoform X1 n=1 Tax=Neltuma alba TaxID=207710 RepID=UPI0010A52285|nr:HEAT repeat-containing protein 6-like isoform X1 [Prosopis alba]
MLDHFIGEAITSDELNKIGSTSSIRHAIECLQAIRYIITPSQRRWSQSEDTLLIKFLLNIIVRTHDGSCRMPHSTCKERSSAETSMRLPRDSSSWELLGVAFSMLGEVISRDGSSFPLDIWRSIIEVLRKMMDGMVSKIPIVEDIVMSRYYESLLHCLHLVLSDRKCSASDHVSVFVSVLRIFLTYGLTGKIPHTSPLIGCEKKHPRTMSPKASLGQGNNSNRGAYRPPHLRKKDCSNLKHNRAWHPHSPDIVEDNECSTSYVASSDSDFSDGDGPAKDSESVLNSKVRVAAIICIQDLCQAEFKSLSTQWSILFPTTDVLQPRKSDATLMTCLLFDPYFKARMASASTLVAMLDGLSSVFLQVAEYKESSKFGSYTALSSSLGQILLQLHRGILYLLQHEANGRLLALLFKILRLVVSSTPYSRMPPDLLPTVVTSLMRRIEEGFRFKSDQTGLLGSALGCLSLALSTSPSSVNVRKMLLEEVSSGFIEAQNKSGVLFMLFEYSVQWSSPTICLEALQALRAACHNYPSIVFECWKDISSTVYVILSGKLPEVPSRSSSDHVGCSTVFSGEKVITAAIKVLDECLRAVSGFQGTEEFSDEKLEDIPFASDCIRMKKVSSAPSYEPDNRDVVISKACESGIQQWNEVIEKCMPLTLGHSSAMVRAASVTCFAGMTSGVFISFTKDKQDFIMSSLISAALHDNTPSVRSAACRAIGIISCFPQVCQSAEIFNNFIDAVETNTRDPLVSVRITASWALANICDSIRHCVGYLPFGFTGTHANPQFIISLSECALHLTKDGDKVKSNAVRALGYISRIFKCTTSSKFQEMSVDHMDHATKAFSSVEEPKVFQGYNSYSCQLYSSEDSHRLEKMVQAIISCITTGNVKVQWNACHALGNLFLNETLRLQDMDWAPFVFGILLQLLRDSSNFKIRIQAAAALAVPVTVLDYGISLSDVVQGVEHVMESLNVDSKSAPTNFKYKIALQKQLTLTMLHVLSLTSSTKHGPLKAFLVKKASFLEDWFVALCSSVEEKCQLDAEDKSIEDRKKVMISRAIQSLIEVYKEKEQHAIAQRFEELKSKVCAG